MSDETKTVPPNLLSMGFLHHSESALASAITMLEGMARRGQEGDILMQRSRDFVFQTARARAAAYAAQALADARVREGDAPLPEPKGR